MGSTIPLSIDIPSDYGYVVLVIVTTWILLNWLGFQVVRARKRYEIHYPTMYSPEISGNGHMFNCVQRAHQNTLEVYPVVLVLLIFGGVEYPKLAALSGVVWMVSRVVYAYGYYTGVASKRNKGAFGYIGVLFLLISTIILGLDLLGIV